MILGNGWAIGNPDSFDTPAWARRFPNFPPQELSSNGNGMLRVWLPALDNLQTIRTLFGKPMIVTSPYRDEEYNRKVGGSPTSFHVEGSAYDISIARDPNEGPILEQLAMSLPEKDRPIEIGRYPHRKFIHLAWPTDTRTKPLAIWGSW
ncbi:MAG: D-Ala-D-Ala carboxypeptidase family metallohydrolase [Pseudomonadota bacterium]